MGDKFFIDSNVLIYAICENSLKCDTTRQLLIDKVDQIVVSSQVINEFIAVSLKKEILPVENIFEYADGFMEIFDFVLITKKDIKKAMAIKEKYKYSYWDSLIIASALGSECNILYSEDMQHGQVIENKLKIINPLMGKQ